MAVKGKQVAEKTPPSSSKSKRKAETPISDNKSGGGGTSSSRKKNKNPGVLRFFDVAAECSEDDEEQSSSNDEDDDDDFDLDFMDEDKTGQKGKGESGKSHNLPFLPKEEELSDEELEILLKERYKPGSQYVHYADQEKNAADPGEMDPLMESIGDPNIWRVKCTVGRERLAAFCLIQKFVDLKSLGNKLKIASAFAPDHIKGYIYIEVEKEIDVLEACKSISIIYSSRISRVPKNEISHLFVVRSTSVELPPGTWVRVKLGKYRGDLAQVVAFDGSRKSATVKLIPRIDLQALSKKLAGGGAVKQTAIPAARVISSKDLEEFQSHIVLTRDRQTGKVVQTLDGLKLKDGFLYKKVSLESITYVDVKPSADEFLKFKPYKKDESDDAEWLSHLYGEQRKKRLSEDSREIGKGLEGTSGAKKGNDFRLHDLVFYGPKEFGVIIGVENDSFQILKYDEVEGAEVLNVELHEMNNGSIEKKFSTIDRHMQVISPKDTVRVMEGPFMGRQGVVKHICRGTIFIYNADQLENGGYFCAKSKSCENVGHPDDANRDNIDSLFGQGDTFNTQGFEDSTSSPKSQQFPKKPWQENEGTHDFNSRRQGDRDGGFSVGQALRIRVGPLKGHLCRVVSIYRSDVTVKVDSQAKVFSVKSDHLSVAGVRSNFTKQSDGFASHGESSGAPTESNGWESAPLATGSSWADLSAPSVLPDSSWKNPFDSAAAKEPGKGNDGDDAWGAQATKKAADSWGNAGFGEGSGKGEDQGNDPWGRNVTSSKATDSWGNAGGGDLQQGGGDDPWGIKATTSEQATDSWGIATGSKDLKKGGGDDPWGIKANTSKQATDSWGIATGGEDLKQGEADDPWGINITSSKATDSWGNAGGLQQGGGNDPWGSQATSSKQATDSWATATGSGDRSAGKGDGNCFNCNEPGHMARDCTHPRGSGDRSAGKGGGTCYNCNEPGHMARECTQPRSSGDRSAGKGGGTCYNCNEPGHMARDCTQPRSSGDRSAGKGGGTCYNCNEPGHMARDCTQPRSSGDRSAGKGDGTCFNCNETGHMARDCTQPRNSGDRSAGKGSGTCFNCNEPGHMARDCTQPRSSGGRSDITCYKCNGVGHMARNCQNQSSGSLQKDGGNDSWGTKPTITKQTPDSWGTSIDGDLNKGGGEDSWGINKGGGDSFWGKATTSKQATDSWGMETGGGDLQKDGGDDPWGSKATTTTKQTADSWGTSIVGGKLEKAIDAGEPKTSGWGSSNNFSTPKASGADQGSSWGKSPNENGGNMNQGNGWDNKVSCWESGAAEAEGKKSSGWGHASDWSTQKDNDTGEPKTSGWGSISNFDTPKASGADQGSSWGNSPPDNGGKMNQVNDWDNKVSSWKSGAADAEGKKSSGWGNTSDWSTPKDSDAGANKSSGWGNGSSWGNSKDSMSNQSLGWNQESTRDNNDTWQGEKSFGGGKTSGWGGGSDNNAGESSHHSNRGRGFGRGGSPGSRGGFGNRGRGNSDGESSGFSSRGRGFRGRGRGTGDGEPSEFSSQGRGFGRGGSHGSNRGGFGGSRGRGRRDQAGGDNQKSWSGSANDGSTGWGNGSNSSGWGSKCATDDAGGQVSSWGNHVSGNSSGWGSKGATDDAGGQVSSWGNHVSGNKGDNIDRGWGGGSNSNGRGSKGATDDAGGQVSGWGNHVSGNKGDSNDRGWGGGSNSYGWGSKGATDDAGGQVSSWGNQASGNKGDSNDGGRGAGNGWGSNAATDNADGKVSDWGNQASGNKRNTNNGGRGGGQQTDSWSKPDAADGNESGGWNKPVSSKEETAGSSAADDTWGKAAAGSSWGVDKGGSSGKGGW